MNRIKFYTVAPVVHTLTDAERMIVTLTKKLAIGESVNRDLSKALSRHARARVEAEAHHWWAMKWMGAAVVGAGLLGWMLGRFI